MSNEAAPKRYPTIADVAERAGVTPSTVSRALSNPDRVNFRTRERIEKIAADLGYVPSSYARALSSGRTSTVALLVPDITNPFYFDIIRGTGQQLSAAGYTQLLVDTEESETAEAAAIDKLRRSADGFVLTASRLSNAAIAEAAETTPIVTINRDVPGVPSVVVDTPGGMRQSIDHLYSLGHRKIAYISGPEGSWSNGRRAAALEAQAASLGIDVVQIGNFAPKTSSGAAAADAALNAGVTACVTFNDLIAIGMLKRFHNRGIDVPADFSVVGCDDIFGADFCSPPLTTITAPIEQAARVAITTLLARLGSSADSTPRPKSLPTYLTVRDSSGPVRRE